GHSHTACRTGTWLAAPHRWPGRQSAATRRACRRLREERWLRTRAASARPAPVQHTARARPSYSCSVPDEPRGQAEVVIPHAWLLPNLSLDAVRALQRGDTTSDLERGDLRLAGIEVLVARNWVKEEFWPRIQDAVQKGYAAEKTYTFLRAHADRRSTRRPKKTG